MAITHAGDVFENPATRETGRIVTGAGDTEGRYMQSETRVRPGARCRSLIATRTAPSASRCSRASSPSSSTGRRGS